MKIYILVYSLYTSLLPSLSKGNWPRFLTWPQPLEMRQQWSLCWRDGGTQKQAWTMHGERTTMCICHSRTKLTLTKSLLVRCILYMHAMNNSILLLILNYCQYSPWTSLLLANTDILNDLTITDMITLFHKRFFWFIFLPVDPSDKVLFTVREREKAYYPEQDDPEVVQPYAAYSPAGHAKVPILTHLFIQLISYELLSNILTNLIFLIY